MFPGLEVLRNCAGKVEEWVCATCTVVQNTCQLFERIKRRQQQSVVLISAHAQHAVLLVQIVTTDSVQ